MGRRVEVRVGTFVAFALMLLFIISLRLVKITEISGYRIKVELPTAEGLSKETPVLMAGIKIGEIKELVLSEDGESAVAILTIERGIKISEDAVAKVRTRGVLGDRYIFLKQGKSKQVLKDGEKITKVEVPGTPEDLMESLSKAAMKMDDISKDVSSVVKSANDTLEKIGNLVDTARIRIESSSGAIEKMARSIEDTLTETKGTLRTFKERGEDVKPLIDTLTETLSNAKKASEEIVKITHDIKEIVASVRGDEGILGKLIFDKKFAKSVTETVERIGEVVGVEGEVVKAVESLNRTVSEIKQIKVGVGGRGEVGIRSEPTYSQDLKVSISYKRNFAEVSAVFPPTEITKNPNFSVKGSLLVGRDFGFLRLKGGLIRSTPGLALDVLPLSFLAVSFEVFSVSRTPNLRGYMNLKPLNYLYFTGGVEDIFNRGFVFTGVGVEVGEKTLKR